jgi:hypothetical protein
VEGWKRESVDGGVAAGVFGGSSAGKFIANRSDAGQGRGDEIAVKMNCSLIVGTFAAARAGPGRVQSARRERRGRRRRRARRAGVFCRCERRKRCASAACCRLCGDAGGTLPRA